MRRDTTKDVELWWRSALLVEDELWTTGTVHRRDDASDGSWFVAWRDGVTHVVAPAWGEPTTIDALRQTPPDRLQQLDFWRSFTRDVGGQLVGPNVHRYLDRDPGPSPGVREVPATELRALTARVALPDLWASGFDVHLDAPGVVAFTTEGGGAVLTQVGGSPRNVALLVAPQARGRGTGTALGRAAASYAVRHHGWCRWRSSPGNRASTRVAERLGFASYATQLSVRT